MNTSSVQVHAARRKQSPSKLVTKGALNKAMTRWEGFVAVAAVLCATKCGKE